MVCVCGPGFVELAEFQAVHTGGAEVLAHLDTMGDGDGKVQVEVT